jgi:hypothetical protein
MTRAPGGGLTCPTPVRRAAGQQLTALARVAALLQGLRRLGEHTMEVGAGGRCGTHVPARPFRHVPLVLKDLVEDLRGG